MVARYKNNKQYRLKGYDYSNNGYYYVTICTENKNNYFGQVNDSSMKPNDLGKIAGDFWLKISDTYNNTSLDEWIIMPNHVHGIIVMHNIAKDMYDNYQEGKNAPWRVPTGLQPLCKNSLSSIINHYKGNVKRWCNQNGYEYFSWQPRFYDHVIRNERSLYKIRDYIVNNPLNWEIDKYNNSLCKVGTCHGAFSPSRQDV